MNAKRGAGVCHFVLQSRTLEAIRKGSTKAIDREAIRLLRQHGIISMAAWVAGFADERDGDYWRTLSQLLSYDPDQILISGTRLLGSGAEVVAACLETIRPP